MSEDDADAAFKALAELALKAYARGDVTRALELMREAGEVRGRLTGGNRKVMVSDNVTDAQLARRGASVARAAAVKSGHPVALAIAASPWKTLTKYASQRLRKSQAALSRYILGTLETPPEVADQVRRDFGLGDDVWPRPPRR